MRMNRLEKMVMNSACRDFFLKHVEAPTLYGLSGALNDMAVLEVGCGRGTGARLLLDTFKAATVVGVDIDDESIHRARKRCKAYPDNSLSF